MEQKEKRADNETKIFNWRFWLAIFIAVAVNAVNAAVLLTQD